VSIVGRGAWCCFVDLLHFYVNGERGGSRDDNLT